MDLASSGPADNPALHAGAVAVVVAIVLGAVLVRRRRRRMEQPLDDDHIGTRGPAEPGDPA
jgi:hypothetical protein